MKIKEINPNQLQHQLQIRKRVYKKKKKKNKKSLEIRYYLRF